jgi:flagellar protein FliO/FliZ
MTDYLLRLLILLPLVGGMAWGSLWLWKKAQLGLPMAASRKARSLVVADVAPLGPGTKLAVVEFAGQRILLAVSRAGVARLADDARGDFQHD